MPDSRRGIEIRVIGGTLFLLGLLALWEGRRLYALRTTLVAGAVVGDDTFPIIVGGALVLLGGNALLLSTVPSVTVVLPRGRIRARMLWGAGILSGYWLVVPWLGYTAGTAVASLALFRAMGGYGWPAALLFAALTTGALHLLFRVWLLQPLPTGVLGV